MWWNRSRQVEALRKTNIRVDMRTYASDPSLMMDPGQSQGAAMSLLNTAIMRGLDVIGVVSPETPEVGWTALQIARKDNLDISVVPGEDYTCSDGTKIIGFLMKQPIPRNLNLEQACEHAHQNDGFVMVYQLSKSETNKINRMLHTPQCPDAIEIYSAHQGAFQDTAVNLPKFVNSGAVNPSELGTAKSYTSIPRKEFEGLGLIPEGLGIDFTPNYIKQDDALRGVVPPAPPAPPGAVPPPQPNTGLV
jgi:hypothetical protein